MHSVSHAFAPLRVDVVPVVSGAGQSKNDEKVTGLRVQAWETFRGNDWDNKGEVVGLEGGALRVRIMGQKAFFMDRSSCESSVWTDDYHFSSWLIMDRSQRPEYLEKPNDSFGTGQHGHLRRHAVLDGQQ